ncbi:MAG TPA: hypothetical protein VIM11_25700 [Tepidisphaeraceae bacterium]|jgi:uncharacterized protein Smg (DUF494 family)
MTKSEIQDQANLDRIVKLRANGHSYEFTTHPTKKGSVALGIRVWHRNDTRRLDETYFWLASFISAQHARAYAKQLEAA